MQIAIHSSRLSEDQIPLLKRLFDFFERHHITPVVSEKFHQSLNEKLNLIQLGTKIYTTDAPLDKQIDLMLSIGGDGTYLDAAAITHRTGIPLAGINCGRLGFLADIAISDVEEALEQFINNDYTLEYRSSLELIEPANIFQQKMGALNEFTVQKRDNSSMISIETRINNEFLATYWADGLIIATPTGSTAYSLSVGGPILTPQLQGMLITPIASHHLTVRPIVVPEDVEIELLINGRGHQFMASIDHHSVLLDFETTLKIKMCDYKQPVIRLKGNTFYKTLRNKLMWAVDRRE